MFSPILFLLVSVTQSDGQTHGQHPPTIPQFAADYLFDRDNDGNHINQRVRIVAERIALPTLIKCLKGTDVNHPFAHIDDLEDNVFYQFSHYEKPLAEFLGYVTSTSKTAIFELGDAPKKQYYFYNLGPLTDGEIQFFKVGNDIRLRYQAVNVRTLVEKINSFEQVKWTVEASDPSITTLTGDERGPNIGAIIATLAKKFKAQIAAVGGSTPVGATVVDHWPVTYLSLKPGALSGDGFGQVNDANLTASLETKASVLRQLFSVDAKVVSRSLLLSGTETNNFRAKEALAKWIDIPFPQVSITTWAYQVNEKAHVMEKSRQKLETIQRGIVLAKNFTKQYRNAFEAAVASYPLDGWLTVDRNLDTAKKLYESYQKFGLLVYDAPVKAPLSLFDIRKQFERAQGRVLPLADRFALMALAQQQGLERHVQGKMNRTALKELYDAIQALKKRLEVKNTGEFEVTESDRRMAERLNDLLLRIYVAAGGDKYSAKGMLQTEVPFRNVIRSVTEHNNGNEVPPTINTLLEFFYVYQHCDARLPSKQRTQPEKLAIVASNIDEMLKTAVDAYTLDINRAIIAPLLSWIREVSAEDDSGKHSLSLVGRTSVTVTSSLGAGVNAEAEGFVPFTPTKSLTKDQLASLLNVFKKEGADGEAANLATFSTEGLAQALSLLADIGPADTTYTQIAPGVSMSVVPTVLPGGRSARLQINLSNTIDVHQGKADGEALTFTEQALLDRIKQTNVSTDVGVDAYDLFELSTIELQHSTLGNRPWEIPLLAGVPILGSIFRGERRTLTTSHRSLTVVQTTIIPRALDLARRYAD